MVASVHHRHPELENKYDPRGSYRMTVSSGAVTTISARTATAGHLFAFRNSHATVKCYVRRVLARFTVTTAYGTAQETGCDMIVARSYSASHTSGTAVDVGGTNTDTGKLMAHMPTSVLASCRVSNTGELTAGTHTFDANPLGAVSHWSSAIGTQLCTADGGPRPLFDHTLTGSPLILATDEGFVLRNLILMGASGVGRWDFTVEWDEGVPV